MVDLRMQDEMIAAKIMRVSNNGLRWQFEGFSIPGWVEMAATVAGGGWVLYIGRDMCSTFRCLQAVVKDQL